MIVLPPEPPIDLDNLDEKEPKQIKNEKMFKCDHCNAVSTKREIIVAHIQQSHSFPCIHECTKIYPTEKRMLEHVMRVHRAVKPIAPANKRKQSFIAKELECEAQFQLNGRPWES